MLTLLILRMVWFDMLCKAVVEENHQTALRDEEEDLDHASVGLSETWLAILKASGRNYEAVGCTTSKCL